MAMEYFPCFDSYLEKTRKLSDQELGRLFRALMTYHATGERQELTGRESMAYDFITYEIDRATEAYNEKCRKLSDNGRKQKGAIDSKCKQLIPDASNCDQSKSKSNSKSNTLNKSNIPRAPYGEFQNVFLSDEELAKLKEKFTDWQQRIETLSAYMKSHGKTYKDYYATILTWARKDESTPAPAYSKKQPLPSISGNRKMDDDERAAILAMMEEA